MTLGATVSHIWRVPAYLPYLQPPLTRGMVARAEEQIGFSLPQEYLRLLAKQNGGYIRYALPDKVHDIIAGIGPHFPSLTAFNWDDSGNDTVDRVWERVANVAAILLLE